MSQKIFISQPMTGLSEEDILKNRQAEIEAIHAWLEDSESIEIINNYVNLKYRNECESTFSHVVNWDIYWLSESLRKLSLSDVLWLGKGWEYSRGCKIEEMCAREYGIPIIKSPREREGE